MYSPKIAEDLVHQLYVLSKARKMPMTRLVDGMIRQSLASTIIAEGKVVACQPAENNPETEPCKAAA